MDRRIYNVILASLEALLRPGSWFWQQVVQNKRNKIQRYFAFITIDKTYMICGWQDFQEKYQILGHLKNVFSIFQCIYYLP